MSAPFFIPAAPRNYNKRKWMDTESPPPTGAPVLIAATYVAATSVTLTFDRAVDIGLATADGIVVRDGAISGQDWIGTAMMQLSAKVVYVNLVSFDSDSSPVTELSADASNGIRNAVDGVAWDGVEALALPFP